MKVDTKTYLQQQGKDVMQLVKLSSRGAKAKSEATLFISTFSSKIGYHLSDFPSCIRVRT